MLINIYDWNFCRQEFYLDHSKILKLLVSIMEKIMYKGRGYIILNLKENLNLDIKNKI